jgi:hypothetical protein
MLIGIIASVWIFLSFLIALGGRNYRFGFWGYFFASILLTPIIGFLLLIAAVPHRTVRSR